jgi:hypothetical protein
MRWRFAAATLILGAVLSCERSGPSANVTATGAAGTGNVAIGGTDGAAGKAATGAGGGAGTGVSTVEPAVFEYNGAVTIVKERVEISAPILPRTTVIYQPFPATLEGEQKMAHDAALLFDWLLPMCAPLYPKITLDPTGAGLTPAQLGMNYDQVGLCAYEQYVAKPYWIPKLVGDVDICGTEMGPGWRLITEVDLGSLRESDFQAVAAAWNHFVVGGQGLPFFFSSLEIWVRGSDGSIQQGTLAPGVPGGRVKPLPIPSDSKDHYEGGLGLRCIRRTDLP